MIFWSELCRLIGKYKSQTEAQNEKDGKFLHRAPGTIYNEQKAQSYDPFVNVDQDVLVTLNEYPYDLADDVLHTLVWFRQPRSEQEIEKLLGHGLGELQWMINLPAWRSCPLRQHAHVFLHILPGQSRQQVWEMFKEKIKQCK